MTTMVFEVGSVIELKLDRFQVTAHLEHEDSVDSFKAVGWVTVVVERDGWVVKTRVEPLVMCDLCGSIEPLVTHLSKAHDADVLWSMVD